MCKQCFAINQAKAEKCCVCGALLRQVEPIKADDSKELIEIIPRKHTPLRIDRMREQREATTLSALIELAQRRGYKWPVAWARRIVESRKRKLTYK